jgi:phenylacetate-CoA ligase
LALLERQEPAVTVHPAITAFLKTLRETQYLPPQRLLDYQRKQLSRLVTHARAETELYARRLDPIFRGDGSIDWQRWQEIPILTRSEAQDLSDDLAARSVPPESGGTQISRSSGSTGRSLEYRSSQIQLWATICANERVFEWHGIDPAKPTALIWSGDEHDHVSREPTVSKGWRIAYPDSVAGLFNIRNTVAIQIAWLEETHPTYLSTYPTNLREICRVAREEGKTLAFEAVLIHGEMSTAETRREIGDYFGRMPIDAYGAAEFGFVSADCPTGAGQHIAADLALIETVREDGSPAAPGEEGRIIATPFYGFAMPLIRYDTGDWGMLSDEPCPCGRCLPLLGRILGRSRNMFRFSDGSRVWPLLDAGEMQKYVPHRQFQAVQTAPGWIEYRYVPISPDLPIDREGLTLYARRNLNPNVDIVPIAVTEIARSAGGKYEDYISLVA